MFVNNNLLANIQLHLRLALATSAEALFTLFSKLDTSQQISPLSITKYTDSDCSHVHEQLSILINTRQLTTSIPVNKCTVLKHILHYTWYNKCKSFTLGEIASLLGLVSNLALTTSQAKYTCITLYYTTFLIIKFKIHAVFSSDKFYNLAELLWSTNITTCNFYLNKAYKTVWDERKPFFITTSMRAEIALLTIITSSPISFL